MNTDKIYAESIAKEYAPKVHSKISALRKLDAKAKRPATIFALQRSMLVSFGNMSTGNIILFNSLTGIAVWIIVALLGINLIRKK